MPGGDKARKADIFGRLEKYLTEYNKVFLVQVDNVSSNQFHKIRSKLRGKAVILMGKNTLIRRKIRQLLPDHPELEKLLFYLKGNVGLCFTDYDDLKHIRTLIEEDRVKAPAKTGAIAPLDVFIEAQNTGMGPEKTSFFQALGIATKIAKGTIEILNRVHLIKEGERVGASAATLLNMLNVSPFTYGMVVSAIYDSGNIFEADVLDITEEQLLGFLSKGANNIACISLATGIPTVVAVPHLIIRAFQNMLKISLATEYTFKEAAELKELLSDPTKLAAAAAAAAGPATAGAVEEKKEEKKEEPEEEEDEDMGFGLFD